MEASAEPLVGEASDGERYAERRGTDEEESYDGPSYTASHFTVLVKPVALTMVLAACVCGAMTPLSGHISTLMARVRRFGGGGLRHGALVQRGLLRHPHTPGGAVPGQGRQRLHSVR